MRKHVFFALMAVAVVTAAVFAPCAKFAFTRYDDIDYVIGNAHLEPGLTPETARWAFADVGYASNWHPLTWISHALDVSLARRFGLSYAVPGQDDKLWAAFDTGLAKLSHVHNLALHVVNAALLLVFMLLLARHVPGVAGALRTEAAYAAAALVLIWSIHPLRAEVVCWVSERKELLSVGFLLLTLICYVKGGASRMWHLASVFAFVPALLAKPVAVSLPAVLLAYDWCLRREKLPKAMLRALPHVVLAAATMLLTMLAQTEALTSGKTIPPGLRVVCAVSAPAKYLAQTFWPFGLSIDYLVPTWSDWGWIAAGGIVLAAVVGACGLWLARPNFWSGLGALAVAWAYVGLVPMLGIVKVGIQPHSDRYTYWIGCGVAAVLFLALVRTSRLWSPHAKRIGVATAVLLAVMSVDTRLCSYVWRNTTALYANAVGKTRAVGLSYHLALEMFAENTDESAEAAEALLRDVLSVRHTAEAEGNLAFILAVKDHRDYQRAGAEIAMYADLALAADPKCCTAWAAKAMLAHRTNRHKEALECMEQAFKCGYDPQVIAVDLDEWRASAAKEEAD